MTPSYKNVTREKVMNFAKANGIARLWVAKNNIETHIANFTVCIKDFESEIKMVEDSYEPGEEMDPEDEQLLKNDAEALKKLERDLKKAKMSYKIIIAAIQKK